MLAMLIVLVIAGSLMVAGVRLVAWFREPWDGRCSQCKRLDVHIACWRCNPPTMGMLR